MDNHVYCLGVVILAVLCLVSPAQALASDGELNGTVLTVWDDTDLGVRYNFEDVRFYSSYIFFTNETGNETANMTEPVPGAQCRIRDNYQGNLSELVEMTWDSEAGLFQHTKSFVYPGEYQFEVECSTSEGNFTAMELTDSFTVSPYPNRECGVDVFGLTVKDNRITGTVKNTGNWYQVVNWSLAVDGKEVDSWERTMEAGEEAGVDVAFSFGVGDNRVELTASTECRAQDAEQMTHTVLEQYSCKNPYGFEGENRCDRGNKRVLVCSGGEWIEDELEYLYNCASPREGEWLRTHCETGYLDNFRCSGGELQQEWRKSDCSTSWRTVGTGCEAECGVSVKITDYQNRVLTGHSGSLTALVKNTGVARERIDLTLYLNGVRESRAALYLDPGEEATRSLTFTPRTGGTIRASIIAETGCGRAGSAAVNLDAIQPVVVSLEEAEEVVEQLQTRVGFSPDSLDIEVGKGSTARIDIQTAEPQLFLIEASGMPGDWLGFNERVSVERVSTQFIYVAPKEAGSYTLELKVITEDGQEFTDQVAVYAAPTEREQPEGWFDQTGLTVKETMLFALANPSAIMGFSLIILLLVLLMGFVRLREPGMFEGD